MRKVWEKAPGLTEERIYFTTEEMGVFAIDLQGTVVFNLQQDGPRCGEITGVDVFAGDHAVKGCGDGSVAHHGFGLAIPGLGDVVLIGH